jgi:hypothetical protein
METPQDDSPKEFLRGLLNPARAGWVSGPEDGRWSSYSEYAGLSGDEQKERCGSIVDRVRMLSAPQARI